MKEPTILELAQKYENEPDKFLRILIKYTKKEISNLNEEFFLDVGIGLSEYSFFSLSSRVIFYALEHFKKNKDITKQSICYKYLGINNRNIGNYKKSLFFHTKALELDKKNNDEESISDCYINLGTVHDNISKYQQATEFYTKALKIKKKIGDRNGEANCYLNFGAVYDKQGQYKKATTHYLQALKIKKEVGDKKQESNCYTNLGVVYRNRGLHDKAIQFHEKSLKIKKEIGDRSGEADCYVNLGAAYYDKNRYTKTLEYHKKALTIRKDIGDRSGEAKCYQNLGAVYDILDKPKSGIMYHNNALKINQEIQNIEGESDCYVNLGTSYDMLTQYQKAIWYYNRALKIKKEIGDRSGESKCLVNLGVDYSDLGDYQKAIVFQKQALKLKKEIGDKNGEAACYINIGISYGKLGSFKKAIAYHKRALRIKESILDESGEADCYVNLGTCYFHLNQHKKAISYQEQGLAIKHKVGDKDGVSNCYGNIGISYCSIGKYAKAIEFQKKSLRIKITMGDVGGESNCYYNLGIVYDLQGQPKQALNMLEKSIFLYEKIGRNLLEEINQISFYGLDTYRYNLTIRICFLLKLLDKAFRYVEQSKSKSFLLKMSSVDTLRPSPHVENELIKKENKLLMMRKQFEDGKMQDYDNIQLELEKIYEKMELIDPDYVFLRKGKSLSFEKIQKKLSEMKNGSQKIILVEYFVTDDQILIFVVYPDKPLIVVPADISIKNLNKFITEDFQEEVIEPRGIFMGNSWKKIAKYLIEPIRDHILKAELVCFVPYGVLHYLPFHALELKEKLSTDTKSTSLIDLGKQIIYLPSASLLQFILPHLNENFSNKNTQQNSLLCTSFSVPDKNDSERERKFFHDEAKFVADCFNGKAYFNSTKEEAIRVIQEKQDILHFACHGIFDETDPMQSGIILTDGKLTAEEIFGLKINAKMIVLSACETGRNETKPGDELIGLTRALFYAGVKTIVVSLWRIDSETTFKTMKKFYEILTDNKFSNEKNLISYALQQAQQKIKSDNSEPFYWSPFIVIGNPNIQ